MDPFLFPPSIDKIVGELRSRVIVCPVGWGYRIHRLLLCRGVRPSPNECPGYDTKQSDGEVPATLELWGSGVPLHCHRSQVHSGPEW